MPQVLTNLTHADATNLVLGTTTGTKIATATSQKLGFYNATPIIQPSGNALTGLSNLGLVASPTLAESDVTNLVTDLAAKSPVATTDFLMPLSQATVSVTGALTLTSTAFGRLHVCSGTSVDYTVTLPAVASNGGKFIGLIMSSALTKLVTIARNTADLIDGATSRILWANEVAILLCDGTNWIKVAGKSIPLRAVLTMTGANSIPNVTMTTIPYDTTVSDPSGRMADPTNHRLLCPRPGSYSIVGAGTFYPAPVAGDYEIDILVNGSASMKSGLPNATANAVIALVAPALFSLNAGDAVSVGAYQASGSTVSLYVGGNTLSATEIITW